MSKTTYIFKRWWQTKTLIRFAGSISVCAFVLLVTVWPPPANVIYSQFWCAFLILKPTKFPHPYRGGLTFYYTSHDINRFIPHVHRAQPLNGFETVWIWLKIEWNTFCWDRNSIFSSAYRALPGSQKLSINSFTEWNFLGNKEKAYQNRGKIRLVAGGEGEVPNMKKIWERKQKKIYEILWNEMLYPDEPRIGYVHAPKRPCS